MTTQQQRDRILKKAYELWETEGRDSGRDMEHWLRAEILISEENKPAKKAKAKAKAKPKAKPAAKAKTKAKAKPTKRKTAAKSKK